jgi:hypothetical protein
MHSKHIICRREFGEDVCGRPIAPVFGAFPEECTSCALRICATKDGHQAAEAILEEASSRLRALVIAADVKGNPWAAKNLHSRFTLLDKLAADLGTRRLLRAMGIAQRLDKKDSPAGKLIREPRRTSLGSMWRNVSPEMAIKHRQGGFEVRYIGVAWQVKVS